ncbi:sensor of ECF-type sigma factor [Algibacter aquimarinus]
MKKLLPIIFLLLSLNVMAQKGNRQQIKALKVAFITEKLNLSEIEAQKFWPVYNEFELKSANIRYKEIRAIRKEIKENIDNMSDEKASELLDKLRKSENRLHELHTGLFEKLSGIISPRKMILLKVAEDDFKRKMLNELKRRKKG